MVWSKSILDLGSIHSLAPKAKSPASQDIMDVLEHVLRQNAGPDTDSGPSNPLNFLLPLLERYTMRESSWMEQAKSANAWTVLTLLPENSKGDLAPWQDLGTIWWNWRSLETKCSFVSLRNVLSPDGRCREVRTAYCAFLGDGEDMWSTDAV